MPQVARPIVLDLPELFKVKLDQYILEHPPDWTYNQLYFYYLIHYLTLREIQKKKKDNTEYFSIKIKYLKDVLAWNIDRYILYLVNGEFLERDNYEAGVKSYRYKLNPKYLSGHCQELIYPGTNTYKKIIYKQELKRSHYDRLDPHLKQMKNQFMKLEFDYPGARSWIESQPDESKKFIYHTMLSQIQDKRFRYFHRNKTNNRLDTNLTNLKSELRQFMIGDFEEIDLNNSQPFLFGRLLEEIVQTAQPQAPKRRGIPLCSSILGEDVVQWFGKQTINRISKTGQKVLYPENGEFLGYLHSVAKGTFYDDFLTQFGGGRLLRKDVKELMFPVFFSQNEYHENQRRIVPYKKEKAQFAKVYPAISMIIFELKRKKYKSLAIFLQKVEARIFIDIICLHLVSYGIIPYTVHDSIIVNAEQADHALQICEDVFDVHFEVIPNFHRDPV